MRKSWRVVVILGILFVVVNIIAFVVPFPKKSVFWISDIFVTVAIFAQLFVKQIAYGKVETVRSKVYGFPILRIGVLYLTSVLTCAIVFIVGAYLMETYTLHTFPVWIPIMVYTLLTGAAVIGLISVDNTRNVVEELEQKTELDTSYMRGLYLDVVALKSYVKDEELSSVIEKAAEAVRYSDPVSNKNLQEIEIQLETRFQELKESVINSDSEQVKKEADAFLRKLAMRNEICKKFKR